ncbi:MAG: hypothetical protein WC430_03360 [Patescibacteria group bacterium]
MKKLRKSKGKKDLVRFLGKKIRRSEKGFLMKLARAAKADEFENESLRSLVAEYVKTLNVNKGGFIVDLDCSLIGLDNKFIRGMVLPPKLKRFDCSENELSCLPDKFPQSLKIVNCEGNKIKKLPIMPKKLKILVCGNTLLKKISVPDSLEILYCPCCQQLEEIIFQKKSRIRKVYCYNNNLLSKKTIKKLLNLKNNGVFIFF